MKNKVGIFYAYWEKDWDADFLPYVRKAKSLGFEVLEINAGTFARMDDRARDALARRAADHGIELTLCIGLPTALDPSSAVAARRKKGIAFLVDSAQAMKKHGISMLSGILHGAWPVSLPGEDGKVAAMDRSIASMKEAIKAAEDCGVIFSLEVVNRFEQFLLNTADEAVQYVRRVGSPALRILLDTFHMNIEEDDQADAIKKTGALIGHLHLGENNRRPPGAGGLPWPAIFDAIKAIDYQGRLVMEPFMRMGGEVGRDIRVHRNLQSESRLDGDIRAACDFVHRELARRS